jgi:hypothetical protein
VAGGSLDLRSVIVFPGVGRAYGTGIEHNIIMMIRPRRRKTNLLMGVVVSFAMRAGDWNERLNLPMVVVTAFGQAMQGLLSPWAVPSAFNRAVPSSDGGTSPPFSRSS